MPDVVRNETEKRASSTDDSPESAAPTSRLEAAPTAVSRGTVVIAVVALLIGVVFGFTMSTVGLR
jgi:hypothetical protein